MYVLNDILKDTGYYVRLFLKVNIPFFYALVDQEPFACMDFLSLLINTLLYIFAWLSGVQGVQILRHFLFSGKKRTTKESMCSV